MHVLLVATPGADALRMRAEAAIVAAGHVVTWHPADSDVLLLCGNPGPDLSAVTDRVWDQMPHPKHRTALTSESAINAVLTAAGAALRGGGHAAGDHGHASMGTHDHKAMSGHDHMSMDGPGGYPLAAGTDEDRDGLEMDVLHRRLGPILPAWPAGLVVDVTLAGDTVTAASATLIDGGAPAHLEPSDDAAVTLDRAAQMLTLAGWAAAAARTLRTRDLVIAGELAGARSRLRPLRRWVRRSAALRWSLRGLPVHSGVDVRGVLLTRLEQAAQLLEGHHPGPEPSVEPSSIPEHIVGQDLGSARLVIASLTVAASVPAPVDGPSGGHHDDRG
jgi:hypothetical protein